MDRYRVDSPYWTSPPLKGLAHIACCSMRTVRRVRADMEVFGPPRAPNLTGGRRPSMLPHTLDAMLNQLLIKPDFYCISMRL